MKKLKSVSMKKLRFQLSLFLNSLSDLNVHVNSQPVHSVVWKDSWFLEDAFHTISLTCSSLHTSVSLSPGLHSGSRQSLNRLPYRFTKTGSSYSNRKWLVKPEVVFKLVKRSTQLLLVSHAVFWHFWLFLHGLKLSTLICLKSLTQKLLMSGQLPVSFSSFCRW